MTRIKRTAPAEESETLTFEEHSHRVANLATHCLRNIAFYRAGWKFGRAQSRVNRPFWAIANMGFIDVAVLEWCKLFTQGGRGLWRDAVINHRDFRRAMEQRLKLSGTEFRAYSGSIVDYRNTFVAHLLEESVAIIPDMRLARGSVAFLFDHVRKEPTLSKYYEAAAFSAKQLYHRWYRQAVTEYRAASALDLVTDAQ
jgi:hypothetical protein